MIAQKDYSMLSDAQLKQAMMFAQRSNDTPEFLGLMSEANRRKQMRSAAQGQQAGQQLTQGPQTQADAVMSGIANLTAPSDEQGYASGGIVAFAGGGGRDSAGNLLLPDEETRSNIGARIARNDAQQVSPLEAMSRLRRIIRDRLGLPNEVDAQPGAGVPAPGASAPAPAVNDRPYINPRTFQYPDQPPAAGAAPQPERRPQADVPTGGISTISRSKQTEAAPPPLSVAAVEKTMTPEELRAKAEALAKGDDAKVEAIFAKAAARDAKRRAELEGETKGTKGWLGAEMDSDTRKALRDFGIAALQSKRSDALGGIGEGLSAAAKGYDERKQKRQDRLDMLDAAEEKRQLAQMAAQQGNMELSRKYIAEAEALKKDAQSVALKKDEAALDRWYKTQSVESQREQNRIHAANAARPTDFQWGIGQLMKANPGMSFGEAMKQFVEGKQTTRPLTRAEALTAYNNALRNGTLPAGIADFESFYKMAAGTGGTAAPATSGWGQATVKN